MSAVVILSLEENPELRTEQRVDRLEEDGRKLQSKIDEHVSELKKAIHSVEISVATLEGSLRKQTPHPWLTPIISVAGGAVVLFLAWMAVTIVQHGAALASIRQSLLTFGISTAANNPTSPKAQAAARANLAEARKTSTTIPASAIEQAGDSFIEAAKADSAAWGTVLDLVSYRTFLNLPEMPQKTFPLSGDKIWIYDVPWINNDKPQVRHTVKAGVPREQAARLELIGHNQNSNIPDGPAALVVIGGTVDLDEHYVRQVIFYGTEVHYNSKSVILENVIFINCKFVIENDDLGRQFAQQVLKRSRLSWMA